MKPIVSLAVLLFFWLPLYTEAQTGYYVMDGRGNLTHFPTGDPNTVQADEWIIQLNRCSGTEGVWGRISGRSAQEVMSKLKKEQDFDLKYARWAHGDESHAYREPLCSFKPLGPIAVIRNRTLKERFQTQIEAVSEAYEDYNNLQEAFENALSIAESNTASSGNNPFENVGSRLRGYADDLRHAREQLGKLQGFFDNLENASSQKIDELMSELSYSLRELGRNELNNIQTSSNPFDSKITHLMNEIKRIHDSISAEYPKYKAPIPPRNGDYSPEDDFLSNRYFDYDKLVEKIQQAEAARRRLLYFVKSGQMECAIVSQYIMMIDFKEYYAWKNFIEALEWETKARMKNTFADIRDKMQNIYYARDLEREELEIKKSQLNSNNIKCNITIDLKNNWIESEYSMAENQYHTARSIDEVTQQGDGSEKDSMPKNIPKKYDNLSNLMDNISSDFKDVSALPNEANKNNKKTEEIEGFNNIKKNKLENSTINPNSEQALILSYSSKQPFPARITYESDQIINYITPDGTSGSINKSEIVMIFSSDGTRKDFKPESEVESYIEKVQPAIDQWKKDVSSTINQSQTNDISTASPSLSVAELSTYSRQGIRKVDEFVHFLTIITDKKIDPDTKDKAIEEVAALFLPEARIEVTSVNRPGVRTYPIKEYLSRLKLLPYSSAKISWNEVHYVKDLTQETDGNYYGVIAGSQKFEGYGSDGKSIQYSDITQKTVKVKLQSYQKSIEGLQQINWEILLGNIGIAITN